MDTTTTTPSLRVGDFVTHAHHRTTVVSVMSPWLRLAGGALVMEADCLRDAHLAAAGLTLRRTASGELVVCHLGSGPERQFTQERITRD